MASRVLLLALLSLPLTAHAQPATTTTTPPAPAEDPTRPPQRCGMTDDDVTFGPISVGTVVTLQRHRFVHGDDNWDPAMLRFLGREARITRLSGLDAQGCPGVRVDLDGGTWFWRVRDLGLGTDVQPRPAVTASTMSFPQNCGMTDYGGGVSYGDAVPGAMVILGRHRPVNGDTFWADDMATYVGRRARVRAPYGVDGQGCPCVTVDVDGGMYAWRIRDFRSPDGTAGEAFDASSYVPSAGVTSDHGRPATSGFGEVDPLGGGGMFGTGGVPGPQTCGLTDATVDWAGIHVGSRVTLGRHRAVDGVDNWDPAMDAYVGRTATVRTLIGVDPQGCPIIYVDVDSGYYFWRVRDLTVEPATLEATDSRPGSWTGLGGGIPTECGHAYGTAEYGPITVGTRVVLGMHSPYTGPNSYGEMVYDDTYWAPGEMDAYVGMTATVTSLADVDPAGCPGVHVDVDGGAWFWRIRDMRIAH